MLRAYLTLYARQFGALAYSPHLVQQNRNQISPLPLGEKVG